MANDMDNRAKWHAILLSCCVPYILGTGEESNTHQLQTFEDTCRSSSSTFAHSNLVSPLLGTWLNCANLL